MCVNVINSLTNLGLYLLSVEIFNNQRILMIYCVVVSLGTCIIWVGREWIVIIYWYSPKW